MLNEDEIWKGTIAYSVYTEFERSNQKFSNAKREYKNIHYCF